MSLLSTQVYYKTGIQSGRLCQVAALCMESNSTNDVLCIE